MNCWEILHMQVTEAALKELDEYILRVLEEIVEGAK